MVLYVFVGIWYVVDNIWKIIYGLVYVINLFILIIWCIDRVFFIWIYWYYWGCIVRKEVIGNNEYVVVYIKFNNGGKYVIGDVYYLL